MTTDIDAIRYRRQIRYFTDEIPEESVIKEILEDTCLLYTSPSPRD